MKKALLTLTLMLVASVTTFAQTTKDVVYLKDGNVIRGQLVEIIPDKQVKIKTADGSLFVYNTNDVARIENAEIAKKEKKSEDEPTFNGLKKIARGFKGFVEGSFSASLDGSSYHREGLSVSLGSQILPQLFVGGGIGFEYFGKHDMVTVPIYLDIRTNFINGPISPFIGTKFGYTFGRDIQGFYFNPMLGCRFGLTNKLALHAAIGYALIYDVYISETYNYGQSNEYYYNVDFDGTPTSAIKIQFGFEF